MSLQAQVLLLGVMPDYPNVVLGLPRAVIRRCSWTTTKITETRSSTAVIRFNATEIAPRPMGTPSEPGRAKIKSRQTLLEVVPQE